MEYQIKIVTPGSHLSTNTFFSLVESLKKDFEIGITEALIKEFPQIGRTKIKNKVKGNISFEFEEMRRGSWEIIFKGAVGGFLGRVAYDLAKDIFLKHPTWEKFREWIYTYINKPAVEQINNKVESRKTIGPYIIANLKTDVVKLQNGDSKIVIEMTLERKNDSNTYSTSEEVEASLEQFFLQENNKHSKN